MAYCQSRLSGRPVVVMPVVPQDEICIASALNAKYPITIRQEDLFIPKSIDTQFFSHASTSMTANWAGSVDLLRIMPATSG
ncbi:hypothetical protein ASD03_18665 [Ensifer sp. Root127]|nr:hypothetical protein ASD03_18665 [Ensifer sp. Root127]